MGSRAYCARARAEDVARVPRDGVFPTPAFALGVESPKRPSSIKKTIIATYSPKCMRLHRRRCRWSCFPALFSGRSCEGPEQRRPVEVQHYVKRIIVKVNTMSGPDEQINILRAGNLRPGRNAVVAGY